VKLARRLPSDGARHAAVAKVPKLLRSALLVVLLFASYRVILAAWTDQLSRSDSLNDRLRAVRLKASASTYQRLAEKRAQMGSDAIPDLRNAVALEPANAVLRLKLGWRAELVGNYVLAEANLLEAANLSRLYLPRFALAQYYFRRKDVDSYKKWSRAALDAAYGDVTPLLELEWYWRGDGEAMARQSTFERPLIARQQLAYLLHRGQMDSAREAASQLAARCQRADVPVLLEYCDTALSRGDGRGAMRVWNALSESGYTSDSSLHPETGISLSNRDFRHPPTGVGFDWRVERASWLATEWSQVGLRITLTGDQPEDCLIAWQYVPVIPGRRYVITHILRPVEFASTSGLTWMFLDRVRPVSSEIQENGSAAFTANADLMRIALRYRRPRGSTRLRGSVSVREVRMELE
jgi:tetratricopeptide (TPR) repeat protein